MTFNMKTKLFIILSLVVGGTTQAQVGVNTQSPKGTLHVLPIKTDGTTAEGIIAPNLSRAQLITKDNKYDNDLRGAIVYVTDADGTASPKTTKITQPGYYYFDGNVWQPFTQNIGLATEPWLVQGGTTEATDNTENIYQTGSVAIGSNSAGTYKFQVTGTSNITGNSRVGSSSVLGAQVVSGNQTVNGNAFFSGGLNYKPGGTAPTANTYLRTDANGNATWQALPTTATTEPWRVQNTTTNATTNTQDIYQKGKVAIGGGDAAVSAYNLDVTGTSNVSGNSRVGSSSVLGAQSVAGNHTVAGTTTLNGTTNTKAVNISGTLNYKPGGTAPAANTYLRTDATGKATWQALPVTATTEPWRVQGGTTNATTNAQNIYQAGKVAIGVAQSGSARTESLYVKGPVRMDDNTIIGASGSTYDTNYTLHIMGEGTLGGLWVEKYANLKNRLTVGQDLTDADEGFSVAKGISRIAGPTFISGQLNYKPGGTAPAANTYLRAAANGNASWQPLPATATTEPWQVQGGTTLATTNAQNIYQTGSVHVGANTAVTAYKFQVTGASNITGNSRVGSNTVVGAQTVGGNHTVTGTTTLNGTTNAKATNISGTLNYKPGGTAPTANTYLRTDANGNASWQGLPATATTEPWRVQNSTTMATTNTQNIYQKAKVAIGGGDAAVSAYTLDVTGTSNVSGNSRVASSTVVGNQTVGGTHVVTGNTGLGTSTLTQKFNVGGNGYISGSLGLGIATPAQKLHVVGNQYTSGISKIGGNTTYNTSAQLELSDNNKGMLPNRVALTSPTVKAPVANAAVGMLVYNTATVGILTPGFYFWNGTRWEAFVTETEDNKSIGFDLRTTVTSIGTEPDASQNGRLMPFGNEKSGNDYFFKIQKAGSYAFAIRVYGIGNPVGGKSAGRACVYFTLMVNGKKVDVQEVNWALVSTAVTGVDNRLGGTVVLTGSSLKSGDKIEFRLAHYNRTWTSAVSMTANPGLVANKTSLVYWRL